MDVLLICTEALEPMCLVQAYPIGVITMIDSGRRDEKIIAIPSSDPTYNHYRDLSELPEHIFEEMKHFFTVYKNLEGKDTVVDEIKGREEAVKIIQESIDRYIEVFCK
jgi:inorganic pyrophosphatase